MTQTCEVCRGPDKFDFHVLDDVWQAVVPTEYQNRIVYLFCFDDFAHKLAWSTQALYKHCISQGAV